jgi:hypothetical protein
MKNKIKAISFMLVCTIFSGLVNAQEMEKTTFGFGAGVNIATVSLHSPFSSVRPNSLIGFRGCVFINAPLGKNFFLQPELAMDWMGWHYDGEDNNSGGLQANIKTYLPYFAMAVLPKYQFKNSGFAVYAGPSYGFLLSATVKGWGGEMHDDKRDYTDGDFGAIVGAEYYLPMGLGISVRYRAGISNIINNPEPGESMHTSAFSITIVTKGKIIRR